MSDPRDGWRGPSLCLVVALLLAPGCRADGALEADAAVGGDEDSGPLGDAGDAGGEVDGGGGTDGGDAGHADAADDADAPLLDADGGDADEGGDSLACTEHWCLVPEGPSTVWDLSVSESGRPWIVSYGVYTWTGATWRRYELSWPDPVDPFRTYTELYAVHALSDRDVWVGGQAGYVGHFNGASWTDRTAAAPWPRGIWGVASDDVWVFYDSGLIYHWDGIELAHMDTAPTQFYGSWGRSATELGGFGHADGDSEAPVSYRWDGSSWHLDELPGPGAVISFWVAPGGEQWTVVRESSTRRTVLRGDGATWSPVTLPGGQIPTAVWGTSSDDVWVVGRQGTISHFDGARWSSSDSGTMEDLLAIDGNGGAIWIAASGFALRSP